MKKPKIDTIRAFYVSADRDIQSGQTCLFINHAGTPEDNSFDYLGKKIGADYIAVITRYIDGEPYDFVIDDNAKLAGKPTSAFTMLTGQEAICGDFLIFAKADRGQWRSIDEKDIKRIKSAFIWGMLGYSL